MPNKVPSFYHISLHIDDEDSVIQNGFVYGYKTLRVYEPDEAWAQKILAEAQRIRRMEETRHAP